MLRLLLTLGGVLLAAAAMGAVLAPRPEGGWRTEGLPYDAILSATGTLESLSVHGNAFLTGPGLFIAKKDAPQPATVTVEGDTATLVGADTRLTLRFLPGGIACTLLNAAGNPDGNCAAMTVPTSLARLKSPETGVEYPLPPKIVSGRMRLIVANGATLTLPDGVFYVKDGGYCVRLPWTLPGGFPNEFRIDITPVLGLDDQIKVAAKAKSADCVYWSGEPQPLTTELTNMLPDRPFRGALVLKVQSFLTKQYVAEMRQPVNIAKGGTATKTWTLTLDPGFYFAEIWAQQGKTMRLCCRSRFLFNAAALQAPPPPADFDAFWQRTLTEQAKVPLDLQITKTQELGKWDVYKFNFAGLLKRRIYGYLTVPKGTTKKLPAVLVLPSAGEHAIQIPQYTDAQGNPLVAMAISITNQDVDLPNEAYDWRTWPAPYLVTGILDKDYYSLRFSYAGVARAAEVLAARPEVQADNILCYGSSQGGGLTFVGAALYPKFKAAVINCPALCRLDWLFEYLDAPFFPIAANNGTRPYILETLKYYDAAYFARQVQCPTWVSIGLLDDGVPAMSVLCAYNALPSKQKTLLVNPLMGHAGELNHLSAKGLWP
jgi:cephalosporin-C deacetylase